MKKIALVILLSLMFVPSSWASHNRHPKICTFDHYPHYHSYRKRCGYWCKLNKRHYVRRFKYYCQVCKKKVHKYHYHRTHYGHQSHHDGHKSRNHGRIVIGHHDGDGYIEIDFGKKF